MARLADAFDHAMANIAANSCDDAERQIACDQDGALLDMQFDPCGDACSVEERLSHFDSVDVGANRAHAFAQREFRVRVPCRQIRRSEKTEERARPHIGLSEPRAFLAAQSEKLQCTPRLKFTFLEAGKHCQSGDYARGPVKIAAARNRIEMRSAGNVRQPRFAAFEGHDQIGTRVAFRAEAQGTRFGFDDVERRTLAFAEARARDALSIAGRGP